MFRAGLGSNRGMKNSISVLLGTVTLFFALNAKAGILFGQVTGSSNLGCMMVNYTGVKQIVYQVEYQYACNHGPQDPYRTYYQVYPCGGFCEAENGQTVWHTNGPWTQNCILLNSRCQGWAYEAPTPRPTPAQ